MHFNGLPLIVQPTQLANFGFKNHWLTIAIAVAVAVGPGARAN